MEIVSNLKDRNLIVKITGDIDHHSSGEIRDKVEKDFSRENAKNILFDFSNVSFMDSSGIGMIIGRYKHIEQLGGKVFACCIRDDIKRIFMISGLHKLINMYSSIDEALNNF